MIQIRVDDHNVDFSKFAIPTAFSKSLVNSPLDDDVYLFDFDGLGMSKEDLLWLIENKIECVILVSGKTWDSMNGLKDGLGPRRVEVIGQSAGIKFFELIKSVFRESNRLKLYQLLTSEKPSTIVLQRWLISNCPTDPTVQLLDTLTYQPEQYYKVLAFCFKARLVNQVYKVHVLSEEEKALVEKFNCSFWELRSYKTLI